MKRNRSMSLLESIALPPLPTTPPPPAPTSATSTRRSLDRRASAAAGLRPAQPVSTTIPTPHHHQHGPLGRQRSASHGAARAAENMSREKEEDEEKKKKEESSFDLAPSCLSSGADVALLQKKKEQVGESGEEELEEEVASPTSPLVATLFISEGHPHFELRHQQFSFDFSTGHLSDNDAESESDDEEGEDAEEAGADHGIQLLSQFASSSPQLEHQQEHWLQQPPVQRRSSYDSSSWKPSDPIDMADTAVAGDASSMNFFKKAFKRKKVERRNEEEEENEEGRRRVAESGEGEDTAEKEAEALSHSPSLSSCTGQSSSAMTSPHGHRTPPSAGSRSRAATPIHGHRTLSRSESALENVEDEHALPRETNALQYQSLENIARTMEELSMRLEDFDMTLDVEKITVRPGSNLGLGVQLSESEEEIEEEEEKEPKGEAAEEAASSLAAISAHTSDSSSSSNENQKEEETGETTVELQADTVAATTIEPPRREGSSSTLLEAISEEKDDGAVARSASSTSANEAEAVDVGDSVLPYQDRVDSAVSEKSHSKGTPDSSNIPSEPEELAPGSIYAALSGGSSSSYLLPSPEAIQRQFHADLDPDDIRRLSEEPTTPPPELPHTMTPPSLPVASVHRRAISDQVGSTCHSQQRESGSGAEGGFLAQSQEQEAMEIVRVRPVMGRSGIHNGSPSISSSSSTIPPRSLGPRCQSQVMTSSRGFGAASGADAADTPHHHAALDRNQSSSDPALNEAGAGAKSGDKQPPPVVLTRKASKISWQGMLSVGTPHGVISSKTVPTDRTGGATSSKDAGNNLHQLSRAQGGAGGGPGAPSSSQGSSSSSLGNLLRRSVRFVRHGGRHTLPPVSAPNGGNEGGLLDVPPDRPEEGDEGPPILETPRIRKDSAPPALAPVRQLSSQSLFEGGTQGGLSDLISLPEEELDGEEQERDGGARGTPNGTLRRNHRRYASSSMYGRRKEDDKLKFRSSLEHLPETPPAFGPKAHARCNSWIDVPDYGCSDRVRIDKKARDGASAGSVGGSLRSSGSSVLDTFNFSFLDRKKKKSKQDRSLEQFFISNRGDSGMRLRAPSEASVRNVEDLPDDLRSFLPGRSGHHRSSMDNLSSDELLDGSIESRLHGKGYVWDRFGLFESDEYDAWNKKYRTHGLSTKDVQKQDAIYELIIREKMHCAQLVFLQQIYQKGLMSVLPRERVNELVPDCLDSMITFHLNLLDRLRKRQAEKDRVDTIADILISELSETEGYARLCINAYTAFGAAKENAERIYEKLEQEKHDGFIVFNKHVTSSERFRSYGLKTLLTMIIGRPTKYALILEQITKNDVIQGDAGTERTALNRKAYEVARNFAAKIDQGLQMYLMAKRLEKTRGELDMSSKTAIFVDNQFYEFTMEDLKQDKFDEPSGVPNRQLLCDGSVMVNRGNEGAQVHLMLFDDILVFLHKRGNPARYCFFPVTTSNVRESESGYQAQFRQAVLQVHKLEIREIEKRNPIFVLINDRGNAALVNIDFFNREDRKKWLLFLNKAKEKAPGFVRLQRRLPLRNPTSAVSASSLASTASSSYSSYSTPSTSNSPTSSTGALATTSGISSLNTGTMSASLASRLRAKESSSAEKKAMRKKREEWTKGLEQAFGVRIKKEDELEHYLLDRQKFSDELLEMLKDAPQSIMASEEMIQCIKDQIEAKFKELNSRLSVQASGQLHEEHEMLKAMQEATVYSYFDSLRVFPRSSSCVEEEAEKGSKALPRRNNTFHGTTNEATREKSSSIRRQTTVPVVTASEAWPAAAAAAAQNRQANAENIGSGELTSPSFSCSTSSAIDEDDERRQSSFMADHRELLTQVAQLHVMNEKLKHQIALKEVKAVTEVLFAMSTPGNAAESAQPTETAEVLAKKEATLKEEAAGLERQREKIEEERRELEEEKARFRLRESELEQKWQNFVAKSSVPRTLASSPGSRTPGGPNGLPGGAVERTASAAHELSPELKKLSAKSESRRKK